MAEHKIPSEKPYTLTLDNGAPVGDNQHSYTAGPHGPVLVDTVLFEKSAAFNRERIPERAVHAKGAGAYGTFTCTNPIPHLSKAKLFSAAGKKTPMVARFSTVAGEKGSSDSARDARGFALKFYTEEGNWDLVGNNSPVFFVRDALKFMDVNHSHKKDPRTNLPSPQAVWDFFSLCPETMHQLTVFYSDRGTPNGLRHMHGFGIHTFSLINEKNERHYVKFHMRTMQGIKCFTREEAQEMGGKDPDYATRDLWDAINRKDFPKWEVSIQVMTEEQASKDPWAFDPTKTWPFKAYPRLKIGEFELNENPTNYFAEIEQAAFSPAHVVPGISFSPDKLLQGRMVSYADAHRYRLGSNYQYLPVNRPRCPFHNYNMDGLMQMRVAPGFPHYEPNSFGGPQDDPKYKDTPMKLEEHIVADRHIPKDSDDDLYKQAGILFRDVMNDEERKRLTSNIAHSMINVPDRIIEKQMHHFEKADPNYARMVREELKKIKTN